MLTIQHSLNPYIDVCSYSTCHFHPVYSDDTTSKALLWTELYVYTSESGMHCAAVEWCMYSLQTWVAVSFRSVCWRATIKTLLPTFWVRVGAVILYRHPSLRSHASSCSRHIVARCRESASITILQYFHSIFDVHSYWVRRRSLDRWLNFSSLAPNEWIRLQNITADHFVVLISVILP